MKIMRSRRPSPLNELTEVTSCWGCTRRRSIWIFSLNRNFYLLREAFPRLAKAGGWSAGAEGLDVRQTVARW
jgi:hypothetical protein